MVSSGGVGVVTGLNQGIRTGVTGLHEDCIGFVCICVCYNEFVVA